MHATANEKALILVSLSVTDRVKARVATACKKGSRRYQDIDLITSVALVGDLDGSYIFNEVESFKGNTRKEDLRSG